MTLEELKQSISDKTGVPVNLLTGETAEENIARAKAILAFKREQKPKTTAEQFAEWLRGGNTDQDTASQALADLETEVLHPYPAVRDGGSIYSSGIPIQEEKSAAQKFSEWLNCQIDPFSF